MRHVYIFHFFRLFLLFIGLIFFTHSANAVIKLRITFSSADWQCYRDQNSNASTAELIVWRSTIPNAGNNYQTEVARYTITGPLTNFDLNVGSTDGHFTCVLNNPSYQSASLTYTSPFDFNTSTFLTDGTVEPFTITCTPPDLTPPSPASAATNTAGTEVALTFDEDIDWFSYGDPADWTLKLNGTATTITAVTFVGSQALLTISPAVAPGVTITIDYDDTNQSLYDNNFNAAMSFVNFPVTNNATASLPILLLYFRGRPVATGFELTWETTLEQNAREMIVERSSDGIVFDRLGSIPVKGKGSIYRYIDRESRGKRFYRLRLVDMDQSYRFSQLIGTDDPTGASFRIFPNPSAHILRLHTNLQDGTVAIRDQQGRISLKVFWKRGQTIDVSTLSSGTYIVEITNGTSRYQERLLIMK